MARINCNSVNVVFVLRKIKKSTGPKLARIIIKKQRAYGTEAGKS
jgi:hypothetical protein